MAGNGTKFNGCVVDHDQQRLSGIRVEAWRAGASEGSPVCVATTDADGCFEMSLDDATCEGGLPEGLVFKVAREVVVGAADAAVRWNEVPGETEVVIELARPTVSLRAPEFACDVIQAFVDVSWGDVPDDRADAILSAATGTVALMLDGDVVATQRVDARDDEGEYAVPASSTCTFDLELDDVDEGVHTLQAAFRAWPRRPRGVQISEPVRFGVDRSPPTVTHTVPAPGTTIMAGQLPSVLIGCVDAESGVDPHRCSATIDDRPLGVPRAQPGGVAFTTDFVLEPGSHSLDAAVRDRVGNSLAYHTEFDVVASQPEHETAASDYWTARRAALEAKLDDPDFKRRVLTDPGSVCAEEGVTWTDSMSRILPPALLEEQADFLLNTDPEEAVRVLTPLMERIETMLAGRDNETLARIRERLGRTDSHTPSGHLTAGTKETISAILQDPRGMLADLGVAPTDAESSYIFPAFPPKAADSMAQWISSMEAGTVDDVSPAMREAVQGAAAAIGDDIEQAIQWLVDPEAAVRAAYPDATQWDLARLPAPMSEDEARDLLTPLSTADEPAAPATSHNSSDLVLGVGVSLLDDVIDSKLRDLFPISADDTVGLPALVEPYDEVRYTFTFHQPGPLQLVGHSLEATGSGSAGVTLRDGAEHAYRMAVTPRFSISADDEYLTVRYEGCRVEVTAEGDGIAEPTAAGVIEDAISAAAEAAFPDASSSIRHPRLSLPSEFADVAVDLTRLTVHDDSDDLSEGDIYIEVVSHASGSTGGKRGMYGEFELSGGESATMHHRHLVQLGGKDLIVRVRGVDRDNDWLVSDEDDMGSSLRVHLAASGWEPGHHAIQVWRTETDTWFDWVVKTVATMLYNAVCWLVNAVVWVINACLELVRVPTIKYRCRYKEYHSTTRTLKSFTLEYDVTPIEPVAISFRFRNISYDADVIYLAFDINVPGIADQLGAKTVAASFVDKGNLGVAVSENLINKTALATWRHTVAPRHLSTSIDSLHAYAWIDVGPPTLRLSDPPWAHRVHVPITQGETGTNVFLEIEYGCPTSVSADVDFLVGVKNERTGRVDPNQLAIQVSRVRFHGHNWATAILNLVAGFYNLFCDISGGAFRGAFGSPPRMSAAIAPVVDLGDMLTIEGGNDILVRPVHPMIEPRADEVIVHLHASVLMAVNQAIETYSWRGETITLAAEGGRPPYKYRAVSAPRHGVLKGTMPRLYYQPDLSYSGEDSLTFEVTDSDGLTDIGTVVMSVEHDPRPSYFMARQDVCVINGIGSKQAWALKMAGATTVLELAELEPALVEPHISNSRMMEFQRKATIAMAIRIDPTTVPDHLLGGPMSDIIAWHPGHSNLGAYPRVAEARKLLLDCVDRGFLDYVRLEEFAYVDDPNRTRPFDDIEHQDGHIVQGVGREHAQYFARHQIRSVEDICHHSDLDCPWAYWTGPGHFSWLRYQARKARGVGIDAVAFEPLLRLTTPEVLDADRDALATMFDDGEVPADFDELVNDLHRLRQAVDDDYLKYFQLQGLG